MQEKIIITLRKPLLAIVIVAMPGGASVSMPAISAVEIFFNNAPPPARQEVVPAQSRGYARTPGYWGGSAPSMCGLKAIGNASAPATPMFSRAESNATTTGRWNAAVGTAAIAMATVCPTGWTANRTMRTTID